MCLDQYLDVSLLDHKCILKCYLICGIVRILINVVCAERSSSCEQRSNKNICNLLSVC